MKNLKVKVYKKLNMDNYDEWAYLWKNSEYANVENSPSWFQTYCRNFLVKDYRVIFIRNTRKNAKSGLKLVLPLIKSKTMNIGTYVCPGNGMLDHSTLLFDNIDNNVAFLILDTLKSLGNAYLTENYQDFFPQPLIEKFGFSYKPSSVNYYLEISQNPMMSMSKKNYRKILNLYKKNKENLEHKNYNGRNTNAIGRVFKLSAESYKSQVKGYSDPFSKGRVKSFYLKLFSKIPENVEIDILYYKSKPIAYFLGFIHKRTYFAFQTAYLSEYRRLNPGKILLNLIFERLLKRGVSRLDFGRGESNLKKELTNFKRESFDIFATANPLVKYWWLLGFSVKDYLKDNKILNQALYFYRTNNLKISLVK